MKLDVITGDPARYGDAFGIIGLEGLYPQRLIHIRHAKRFVKEKYFVVANHFSMLQKKINPDIMAIETNYRGRKLLPLFQEKYKLPMIGIHTLSNLTDKTRRLGHSMDKPFMMNWYAEQQRLHRILYPDKRSADMEELINQTNEMVGITQPSGHVSYKRTRGRHDDLFMPKLIGCNIIRIWWEEMEEKTWVKK